MLLVAEIESVETAVPPDSPTGLTLNDVPSPGEEIDAARLTKQQKPFEPDSVIVAAEKEPTCTVRLVGLAAMAKSTTRIVIVVECARDPLVPVTVTE